MQIAAGEGGLEEVGGVHGAVGLPRADDRVELVHEQDDPPVRLLNRAEHRLEPFLELAPELRAGDERAHVQRHHLPVAQPLGDVALHDAEREPLGDGGLADPRLPDEDRVVLGAPGEDLHHPADLVVAADDGIELVGAGEFGEVTAVVVERLIGAFGIRAGGARRAAHRFDRRGQPLPVHTGRAQRFGGGGFPADEREQQVLDAQELVALLSCRVGSRVDHPRQIAGGRGTLGLVALHGEPREGGVETSSEGGRLDVEASQQPEGEPIGGVFEKRRKQVLRGGFRVLAGLGEAGGAR